MQVSALGEVGQKATQRLGPLMQAGLVDLRGADRELHEAIGPLLRLDAQRLTLIGHRAMVYIELKTPFGEVGELEKQVSQILLDHNGPTAVIGFNPYARLADFLIAEAQHHESRQAGRVGVTGGPR